MKEIIITVHHQTPKLKQYDEETITLNIDILNYKCVLSRKNIRRFLFKSV